ncbi:transcriptional regulator with XRE-family HTH domain [Crossiella equi]|uniref:Transcriptional regulator with XRE-family HTH domain n=1 Tax=Crossiella equi TaxID=130796 RepID=A0ABS5ANY2_9PSEU|nr:helix-turn-helix domain-containing protein [Crossiella equi]MBP2478107.1 transcriptional regulator with XRE-family HTH domain [Crossiella equi]
MGRERAGQVLATNLRTHRESQGLSLSELARRSNIAKGTLSQLESGTGNPTIETVFSLSNALNIPVSTLLTDRPDPAVTLIRSADLEPLSGDAVDLRLLRRLDHGGALLEIYDQRVRPGVTQRSAGHPGTEHTTVVSGTLVIRVNGREHEVGPGDYVAFQAGVPHEYAAKDDEVRSVLLLEHPAPHPGEQAGGRPAGGRGADPR